LDVLLSFFGFFTLKQGFRKYLTQARDHEELLSFLLGQIVKEKARFFQLQRHQQPELVSVNTSELDERVRDCVAPIRCERRCLMITFYLTQAKEHEIYDTTPFLQSRLFTANGYTLDGDVIKKRFKQ
jgi:DNA replication licensing factor MCM2